MTEHKFRSIDFVSSLIFNIFNICNIIIILIFLNTKYKFCKLLM